MEHIIDLETRFESMRLKHKKLKKRYNELENSIYEPVVDVDGSGSEPQEHVQEMHAAEQEMHEQTQQNDEQLPQPEQPVFTAKRRLKKSSWRDSVQYM